MKYCLQSYYYISNKSLMKQKSPKMSVLYMNPQILQFQESFPNQSVRHKSLTLKSEKLQHDLKNIGKINLSKFNQYRIKKINQTCLNATQTQLKRQVGRQENISDTMTNEKQKQIHVSSFQLYRLISKQRNHKRGFSEGVINQIPIQLDNSPFSTKKSPIDAQKTTYEPGKKIKIYQIQNYFNPAIAIHTKPQKGTTFISSFPRKINKRNSTDKKHLKTIFPTNKQQISIASRRIGLESSPQGKQRNIKTAFQLRKKINKYKYEVLNSGEKGICISLPIWQKGQRQQKQSRKVKLQNFQKKIINQNNLLEVYRPWSPKNPQLLINTEQQMDQSIKQFYSIQK